MTDETVLTFMTEGNRPHSANDVVVGLGNAIGKAAVQKSLDKLVGQGKVREKTYGKQKIYCIVPSRTEENDSGIDEEIQHAEAVLSQLQSELSAAELNLKSLQSSKPLSVLLTENSFYRTTNEELRTKIASHESSPVVQVTGADRKRIESLWTTRVKDYKKRKRTCMEILDQILENYPKSKKQLFQEIGVEDDESVSMPKLME